MATGNFNHRNVPRLLFATTFRPWALPLALLLLPLAGCGTTQLSPGSRRLLEAVQTAVSAKNSEWLEAAAQRVEAEHAGGTMPDADERALQAIIATARDGDWQAAQSRAFALSEAQRPSAGDLERARAAAGNE